MTQGDQEHLDRLGRNVEEILNVQREEGRRAGAVGNMVASVGRILAHPAFLIVFVLSHLFWIACNLPLVPWEPWDPYPFTFLATLASVEAPFIALLVLMYQRRMQRIADVREEVSLQFVLHAEQKTTMTLKMIDRLAAKMGIDDRPKGLDQLMQDLDPQQVMEDVERDIEKGGDD